MQMQIIIEKFLRSSKPNELNLSTPERLLLFYLGSYIGNSDIKDYCYPSFEALMQDLSVSIRLVPSLVKSLEEKKLIFVKRAHRKNNEYRLNVKLLSACGAPKSASRVHVVHAKGARGALSSMHVVHSNNINTITSLNNKKSCSKYELKKSGEKPSPLLEEFLEKEKK